MIYLRNPEVKRSIVAMIIVTILACCIGFYIDAAYGVSLFFICVAFSAIELAAGYRRYRKLSGMAADIDNLLHGNEHISFESYREGELAILEDEVSKLTVRLSEQADELKKEKIYLSDSIADISHQIRTPLTSVNLIIARLSDSELTEEKRRELIGAARRHLKRIEWLITSLLKISKLDAGTAGLLSQEISVEQLINQAVQPLLIPMELKEQSFITDIEPGCCFTGDMSWSVEAVGNVLKNCMEHTPDRGTLTVKGSSNMLYTQLIIADTGSGIDSEDMPHLFERFYKGKNSSEQSVGIGLALARMIIAEQNGTIKAENHKEGGALFTIRFYKGVIT